MVFRKELDKKVKVYEEKISQGMSTQSISVIIPTLNEATQLPMLLDALQSQTRPPDEIIITDAGSKDGTAELARRRKVEFLTTISGGPRRERRQIWVKI